MAKWTGDELKREQRKRELRRRGAVDWNVPAIDYEDPVGQEPEWGPRPE
jgi:hypothetical protein